MKNKLLLILVLTNWVFLNAQFTIIPTTDDRYINGLVMHGDTLIIKGSTDYLGKSYDMGNSIQEVQDNLPLNIVHKDLQIVDDVYYLRGSSLGGTSVSVIRSENYGMNWDTLYQNTGLYGCLAVYDSTRALLGGLGGGRFSVFNISESLYWYPWPPFVGGGFSDAKYLNKDTCFLLGSMSGIISFDGGDSWNLASPSGGNLNKVQFVGGDTIYAAGGSHDLLFNYSYNLGTGGGSVLYDNTGYDIDILNMWFDNSMHGYLFGAAEGAGDVYPKCAIYETFDRGLTWTQHQLDYDGVIASVVQANDSIFFLGGADPWQNSLLLKWNRNQPFQTLGVEMKQKLNSFSVYPNPAKDEINIESPILFSEQDKIQILDISGKLIKEIPFQNTVNISALTAGIYLVVIENGNGRGVQKLIVE